MAGPGETDNVFIREVDEEYRRERLAQFWSRYGRWILIAVSLFLIGLAGILWWREEQARRAGETGETFIQALRHADAGRFDEALPLLEQLGEVEQPGYRAVAKLTQAAALVQQPDGTDKALTLYRAVADDAAIAEPFRELATIKALRLEFDRLPPATLIERLRPLAQAGNPWFGSAGEMLAMAYLRDNKPDLAGPLFAALANDETMPTTLRARASQMAASLGAMPIDGATAGEAPATDTTSVPPTEARP